MSSYGHNPAKAKATLTVHPILPALILGGIGAIVAVVPLENALAPWAVLGLLSGYSISGST
jgi:hypothetical protein